MGKFQIQHDRPNCIGCGACAAIHPDRWTMSPADGKSDVVGSSKRGDGWEIFDLDDVEFDLNKQCADACPVNVIHLVNKETGEKLI